jgi:hypothetical protein
MIFPPAFSIKAILISDSQNSQILVELVELSSDIIKFSHHKSMKLTPINLLLVPGGSDEFVEGKCWSWHLTQMDHQSFHQLQLWCQQL